ncbi:Uma2 family endonuclease [Streptomyces sp. MST-110588]|uniref:Uma2 family endonuclease n=1 Tax=Streptomyces sp. MST-110588 TaxID=2833628 RepID=UPI001F5C68B4|nr:Uma2 family endonuclease [Streptomyces sp. MST-110588]UNO39957.1 Uma2 family endonuclease [Streptomyces sp. MST-110588]
MTIELTDSRIEIEMADSDELSLDMMFDWLERMPVPEGYRAEIVEGAIYVSPQRDNHWDIIAAIYDQLREKYPRKQLKSDVRIDFPGHLNGFASDVIALRDGAVKDHKGRWRYEDIEFVAEVISRNTARNDYGPKLETYAVAEVPVYLIIDPCTGTWHLHTLPKDGKYHRYLTLDFGDPVDLTDTAVGLTLTTDEFPRD